MDVFIDYLVNEENITQIHALDNKTFESIQYLIAMHSIHNLKNNNYQVFIRLAYLYFLHYKYTKHRAILMETIFKYLYPRSEFQEGFVFFTSICTNIKPDFFYAELAFALFFAYQLKKFDEVQNILNFYFLPLYNQEYCYYKYYCMYFFYQGQIFLSEKVN